MSDVVMYRCWKTWTRLLLMRNTCPIRNHTQSMRTIRSKYILLETVPLKEINVWLKQTPSIHISKYLMFCFLLQSCFDIVSRFVSGKKSPIFFPFRFDYFTPTFVPVINLCFACSDPSFVQFYWELIITLISDLTYEAYVSA